MEHVEAYFGYCPECGDDNEHQDCLNVRASHFGCCHLHRLYWLIGLNLFSAWKDEDESIWKANAERLEGYVETKPAYCECESCKAENCERWRRKGELI